MIPCSIYVAGATNEAKLIAELIEQLENSKRYYCTLNWSKLVLDRIGEDVTKQQLYSDYDRGKLANMDRDAVLSARVMWLVVPETISYGCWAEWGIAIIDKNNKVNKHLIVSGNWKVSIFTEYAQAKYTTHNEALNYLIDNGPP